MARRPKPPTSDTSAAAADKKRSQKTLRTLKKQARQADRLSRKTDRAAAQIAEIALIAIIGRPERSTPRNYAPLSKLARAKITRAKAPRAPRQPGDLKTTRATNSRGEMTIHFHQRQLSKGNTTSSAIAHQRYIEREAAQDILTPAAQTADPAIARAHLVSTDHQTYLEREGATDRVDLAASTWASGQNMPIEMLSGIAVDGNIGETLPERLAFWQAVEERERTPGPGFLRVYIERNRWESLLDHPDFPPELRDAKLLKWSRRDLADLGEVNDAESPTSDTIDTWRLPADTPGIDRAAAWLKGLPDPPTLDHEPGRGGRIQYRLIAELPHELTSAQRFEIVREFTEHFRRRKLPYFAALHRPDLIKKGRDA